MLEQNRGALIRATIEEELGSFRHFAHLPATEIEEMAARIFKAISGTLQDAVPVTEPKAA